MKEIKSVADLKDCHSEAMATLSPLFSEQRSNILLKAGNHYAKKEGLLWRSIRQSNNIGKDQKIRLTKNHVQKIANIYINALLNSNPGTQIDPKNASEYHDQQVALMHNSVWADIKERNDFDTFKRRCAQDFIVLGEVWVKIFTDPDAGEFQGYEPKQNDKGEFLVVDGMPQADAVFSGQVMWERHLGFNVITDPSARSYEECRWVTLQKMVPTDHLKEQFKDDADKEKFITESSKQTWMLFDSSLGNYKSQDSGLTMVKETYARPCPKYPNGYYWIWVEEGILYKGELPHGIFPIRHVGFDDAPTSARSYSIIKQLRPYQAEINRAASKIAEHQTTLGDDKLILQAGAQLSAGGSAHGVKAVKTTGPVTVLPGRSGDQFAGYLDSQVKEMYFVANVEEETQDKQSASADDYTLLYKAMRDKKRFSIYADKFEGFLKDITMTSIRYAKADYDDEMIIRVLGRKEIVNIPEFKSADDLSYEVVVSKNTEDIESRLGRQMALNHLIQYAGQSLKPEEIGQVIKNMPFINKEEIFSDLTLDYENMRSDILAMDRGQFIPANPNDNHQYIIKHIIHRQKMKDYQFLPPFVQSNYDIKLKQHEQIMTEQQQAAAQLSSGFIPSGGFLVKCDLRVPDPLDPSKTKILKLPIESVSWLLDRLEKQGTTTAMLTGMPDKAEADVGAQVAALMQGVPDQMAS